MTLAIFDLDNTLIAGDSDYLWGEYMVDNQIVDAKAYRSRNAAFYEDYKHGRLDNDVYLKFALEPLTHYSIEQLYRWREDFINTQILPILQPGASALLQHHRDSQHSLLIVSATNLFLTEPIAALLDVPVVLSTEPEIRENRYTGAYLGIPTYKEGKVKALQQWMEQTGNSLEGSYFYSDSITDLALLERVDNPIAVNPESELESIAKQRGWEIMDLA